MEHETCNPSLFKCYMLHALCFVIALCGIFFFLSFSQPAHAADPQVEADVNVTATVDSKVSPINSDINLNSPGTEEETNTAEIIAGSGIKIPVIIKLLDAQNNPLVGIKVELRSNRGDIDLIEAVPSQNSSNLNIRWALTLIGRAQAADSNRINYTDNEGIARFTVTSDVPGEATFTAFVDNMVFLNQSVSVTFSPPPFPSSVKIKVRVPFFENKEITIFNSQPAEQANTPVSRPSTQVSGPTATSPGPSLSETPESANLVNTNTEIHLPFIALLIIILAALAIFGLPFVVLILLIKIRKSEKKEEGILNGLCLTRGCPKRIGEQPQIKS